MIEPGLGGDFERISVVVPMLDEAVAIRACLRALAPLRAAGGEVIVVDGGSTDGSIAHAGQWADRIMVAPRGRAAQMNAGAAIARGAMLCFVHADTRVSPAALEYLARATGWGRFTVRFSGRPAVLRVVAWMMNRRSCLTGIATGDQCLFVSRGLFEQVGGFPTQPLMEDVEISKRLRRLHPPHCASAEVITDSRRWERRGVLRTILLMWWLRLAYFLGAHPTLLAAWYR